VWGAAASTAALTRHGGRRRQWLLGASVVGALLTAWALLDLRLVVGGGGADGSDAPPALTLSVAPRRWRAHRDGDGPAAGGGGWRSRGRRRRRHDDAAAAAAAAAADGVAAPLLALPPGAGDAGPWAFALVADMDRQSRRYDRQASADAPSSKRWVSYLKRGLLTRLPDPPDGGRGSDRGGDAATRTARAAATATAGGKGAGGDAATADAGGDGLGDRVAGAANGSVSPRPRARPPAYAITWFDAGPGALLWSRVNEDGRGMELSELAMYRGRLYAPDDRTGVLFEVLSPRGGLPDPHGGDAPDRPPSVTRRTVLADGDGESAVAFKAEWMGVKRGELIIGGHGREVTAPADGRVVRSTGPLWVKVLSKDMTVTHVNWADAYDAMRRAAGAPWPGFLLHEAGRWSDVRGRWLFLPRHKSVAPFDPVAVERAGWNGAVTADAAFATVTVTRLGGVAHAADGADERGFSTFAFVPGTGDRHVLAVRTVEREGGGEAGGSGGPGAVESFISVLDTGEGGGGGGPLPERGVGPGRCGGVEFL